MTRVKKEQRSRTGFSAFQIQKTNILSKEEYRRRAERERERDARHVRVGKLYNFQSLSRARDTRRYCDIGATRYAVVVVVVVALASFRKLGVIKGRKGCGDATVSNVQKRWETRSPMYIYIHIRAPSACNSCAYTQRQS